MPDIIVGTNTETSEICIPFIGRCDPTGGGGPNGGGGTAGNPYFSKCDEKWDNNLCDRDKPWKMPYREGDSVNFQNITRDGQDAVIVLDGNGNPIPGATIDIISILDGFQNISITVPPEVECFSVGGITDSVENPSGEPEFCINWDYTQECDPRPTFKVRGIYQDGEQDCFGFLYPHDNSIRLYGHLVEGKSSNVAKTIWGSKVKKRKIDSFYVLYINDCVPPAIHRVLSKQILAANTIEITDESGNVYEMITEDEFTLSSEDTGNKMFYYGQSIILKLTCEVAGKC